VQRSGIKAAKDRISFRTPPVFHPLRHKKQPQSPELASSITTAASYPFPDLPVSSAPQPTINHYTVFAIMIFGSKYARWMPKYALGPS
jgi:hypothetical protein